MVAKVLITNCIGDAITLGYILGEKKSFNYGQDNNAVTNAALEKKGQVIGIRPEVLLGWKQQQEGFPNSLW